MRLQIVAALMLSASLPVFAAGDAEVQVDYLGEREYAFQLNFFVHAPPRQVIALLTDYDRLSRLNSSILESAVTEQLAENTTRVKTRIRACVWFFCKQMTLVEDVHRSSDLQLSNTVVPLLSDVESGYTNWRLQTAEDGTQIFCESRMRFRFWAPPLIGPAAIKHALRHNVKETIAAIEQLSKSPPVSE